MGVRHLLQNRLPRIHRVSVRVRGRVIVPEYLLLLQIIEVRANFIEAAVDIVPAGVRGIERIVADGVQYAPHRREVLVGIDDGLRQIQILRIVEDIVDLLHEHVRRVKHDNHNRAHADDQEDAAQSGGNDLTKRRLHFAAGIEHLAHHRRNGKPKRHRNPDECHAPVDIGDRAVVKKDIHEVIPLAVVADLGDARKDLEHLVKHTDNFAQSGFHIVQKPADKAVQHELHNGVNYVKYAV